MIRSVILCLSVMACAEHGSQVTPELARFEREVPGTRDVDLLLVIDSSPAMAAHRENVLANVRRFATVLESFQDGLPDLHAGVITADVGTKGSVDTGPTASIGAGNGECTPEGDRGRLHTSTNGSVAGPFISDLRSDTGGRTKNYVGAFADVLVSLADVGSTGCVVARPLEAMRRAFASAANVGFLRPDAHLLVVFITADDDCSFANASFLDGASEPVEFRCVSGRDELVPVAEYVTALRSLKVDSSKIIVAGAIGPASPLVVDLEARTIEPSCEVGGRAARPAVRLHDLIARFPDRSDTAPLCAADLSDVLLTLAELTKRPLDISCFDRPLADLDATRPGPQPECTVRYRRPDGRGAPLFPCNGTGSACWTLDPQPDACPLSGFSLRYEGLPELPDHTRVIAECLAQ